MILWVVSAVLNVLWQKMILEELNIGLRLMGLDIVSMLAAALVSSMYISPG